MFLLVFNTILNALEFNRRSSMRKIKEIMMIVCMVFGIISSGSVVAEPLEVPTEVREDAEKWGNPKILKRALNEDPYAQALLARYSTTESAQLFWLKEAAKVLDAEKYHLAMMPFKSINDDERGKLLLNASEGGYVLAQTALADFYLGKLNDCSECSEERLSDLKKSIIYWLIKGTDAGDHLARILLARVYTTKEPEKNSFFSGVLADDEKDDLMAYSLLASMANKSYEYSGSSDIEREWGIMYQEFDNTKALGIERPDIDEFKSKIAALEQRFFHASKEDVKALKHKLGFYQYAVAELDSGEGWYDKAAKNGQVDALNYADKHEEAKAKGHKRSSYDLMVANTNKDNTCESLALEGSSMAIQALYSSHNTTFFMKLVNLVKRDPSVDSLKCAKKNDAVRAFYWSHFIDELSVANHFQFGMGVEQDKQKALEIYTSHCFRNQHECYVSNLIERGTFEREDKLLVKKVEFIEDAHRSVFYEDNINTMREMSVDKRAETAKNIWGQIQTVLEEQSVENIKPFLHPIQDILDKE